MTLEFTHATLGQRVLFGTGKAAGNVAAELDRLGTTRPMVIASASGRRAAATVLAGAPSVLWWDEVVQHVPVTIAERARSAAAGHRADVLISVGGGSATGLAKAVALTTGIPIIAVPTTYAGSEATNVWGMTEDRTKRTGLDNRTLPAAVVYDANLSRTLPVGLSVASGLNGLAHCIDSLWAPRTDPINQALALEGVWALNLALRGIVIDPGDIDSRERALYGCYLGAVAFSSAGSGLHHKICHVLGGSFDLPHAQTHAVVLPHVLAYNAPAVSDLAGRLATALGYSPDAAGEPTDRAGLDDLPTRYGPDRASVALTALLDLYSAVDAPSRLADYGFTSAGIGDAVERVVAAAPASNPVQVTQQGITSLLEHALLGIPPQLEPTSRADQTH
jgi:maleylacetate reductase